MSRALLVIGFFTILCACTSLKPDPTGRRPAAAVAGPSLYDAHMQVLNSIPLVKGAELRNEEGEAEDVQTLIQVFNKIENESKTKGELNRGTHALGSCFNGTTTILSNTDLKSIYNYDDDTIAKLKQGIFTHYGEYKTQIRFANAHGQQEADTSKDVRGFSFAIELGGEIKDLSGESRQDFMMNTTPMFAVNNADQFLALMLGARAQQGDTSWKDIDIAVHIPSVLRAASLLKEFERNDTVSYTTEEYWGNLPYTHGLNHDGGALNIVKYKATPCNGGGIQHASSAGKPSDYLQKDIAAHAAAGDICFLLQVQFFDQKKLQKYYAGLGEPLRAHALWTKKSDWIENGGEHWPDGVLPFYTVAKVEIKKSAGPAQASCDNWYVNTRLHSNPENLPIGSLARLRPLIEENSRARRMHEIQ